MKNKTILLAWMVALLVCSWSWGDLAIMPLGDSITYGAKINRAGYRYPLYLELTQRGIGFHYVGQSTEDNLPLPLEQQRHNGYPGATIEDIRGNLTGNPRSMEMVVSNQGGYWMTGGKQGGEAVKVDAILLLIGTNNIIHHANDSDARKMQAPYQELVQWLLQNRPGAHLFLGTVLPITRSPARQNEVVVEFNQWLKTQAPAWGTRCHLVDLYPLFLNADGSINGKLLPDGVHPDQTGYNLMGEAWSKAIAEVVNHGELKKEAPAVVDGKLFAAASGKQSLVPVISELKVEPLRVAAGAVITVSGTCTSGNRQLSSPVVTCTISGGKGPAQALTPTLTLPAMAPHATVPFKLEIKLPEKLPAGVYFTGVNVKAAEGGGGITFGPKVTIAQ